MRINNVSSGYTDPAALGKRAEALDAATGRRPGNIDSAAAATPPSAALVQALAGYDVTDISPSEFSALLQKLHNNGAISGEELQELSAVRVDLENAGIEPDQKINLVDFYAKKVKDMQGKLEGSTDGEAQKQLVPLMRRRDWIDKFSLIHANPESIGFSAAA